MTTNRVKRMLAEQHEYTAKEDAESKHGTYEVQADHRAYGVRCCELCGGQIGRDGSTLQSNEVEPFSVSDAALIVAKLCNWATSKSTRKMMICVAMKIAHPTYTVRGICDRTGFSKTQVSQHLNNAIDMEPRLARALGFSTDGQTGQGKGDR